MSGETLPVSTDAISSCKFHWFNATDKTYADTAFKVGCQYQLYADIETKAGYVFPYEDGDYPGKVIIDGKAAKKITFPLAPEYSIDGSPMVVLWSEYYTPVEKLPSGQITEVKITGVKQSPAHESTAIEKTDLTTAKHRPTPPASGTTGKPRLGGCGRCLPSLLSEAGRQHSSP